LVLFSRTYLVGRQFWQKLAGLLYVNRSTLDYFCICPCYESRAKL